MRCPDCPAEIPDRRAGMPVEVRLYWHRVHAHDYPVPREQIEAYRRACLRDAQLTDEEWNARERAAWLAVGKTPPASVRISWR